MKYLLLFLLFTSISFGQNVPLKEHAIDASLKECLAAPEGTSTAGMIACTITAKNAWDAEMNKYYKRLMDVLNPDEKLKLKESQRHWIAYRDKEMAFSSAVFANKEGTMWRVIAASNNLEIVKKRAQELTGYYELLTQE